MEKQDETLTPEQIKNWRRIIGFQLYTQAESMGLDDPGSYTLWASIIARF